MPLFDITLHIQEGEMYCANCSRTIKASIQDFLQVKEYSVQGIYPDFRSSSVAIEGLEAADSASVDTLIIPALKQQLSEAGYSCVNHSTATIDDVISEEEQPVNHPGSLSSMQLFLALTPTLGGGIALMVLEHMGLLPGNTSPKGRWVNLSIGTAATIVTILAGKKYFKNAWRTHGAMDTLISIGAISAILYSFLSIAFPTFFHKEDSSTFFSVPLSILGFLKLSHALRNHIHDKINAQTTSMDTYKKQLPRTAQVYSVPGEENAPITLEIFESAKLYPSISKGDEAQRSQARGVYEEYMSTQGLLQQSTPLKDEGYSQEIPLNFEQLEQELPVSKIAKNNVIFIDKGMIVPIDGWLLNPSGAFVQEAFYGKKGLTKKEKNSLVYAGTVNTETSALFLLTDCEAQDSYIRKACANIKKEIPPNRVLEITSKYFLAGVMTIAVSSAVFWLLLGPEPAINNAIQVFLSVILSACPCGLGLVDMGASITKALAFKEGILIQEDHILDLHKVTAVVFDKCGTLTSGKYAYEGLVSIENNLDAEQCLDYIITLEQQIPKNSRTAVAKAILEMRLNHSSSSYACSEFQENPRNKGAGGSARINGDRVVFGNKGLLNDQNILISNQWMQLESDWANRGYLPIFLAINSRVHALFILRTVEEETQELRLGANWTIQWLADRNKTIYIVTGDTEERTDFFRNKLSKNQEKIIVQARQTPKGKVDFIEYLQNTGEIVLYAGDDENDRPAMQAAAYSAAISPSAPVSAEADAVLNESLVDIPILIALSEIHQRNYYTSLSIAFGVNIFGLFLAAGVFYPLIHEFVDPMITGMIMAASSLFLIVNISAFQYSGNRKIQQIREKSSLSEEDLLENVEENPTSPTFNKYTKFHFFTNWLCCQKAEEDREDLEPLLPADFS